MPLCLCVPLLNSLVCHTASFNLFYEHLPFCVTKKEHFQKKCSYYKTFHSFSTRHLERFFFCGGHTMEIPPWCFYTSMWPSDLCIFVNDSCTDSILIDTTCLDVPGFGDVSRPSGRVSLVRPLTSLHRMKKQALKRDICTQKVNTGIFTLTMR